RTYGSTVLGSTPAIRPNSPPRPSDAWEEPAVRPPLRGSDPAPAVLRAHRACLRASHRQPHRRLRGEGGVTPDPARPPLLDYPQDRDGDPPCQQQLRHHDSLLITRRSAVDASGPVAPTGAAARRSRTPAPEASRPS